MAKVIWCSKGFCDRVAPVGVALGALAAVDELRKAKGLAPVCLPFLAEYLLPHKVKYSGNSLAYDLNCLKINR